MIERCNRFFFQFRTADRADLVFASRDGAGGRQRYDPVARSMSERWQFAVCGIITARASVVSVPADRGAGRCFRVVMDKLVSECRNRFHFEFRAAYRADLVLASGNRAGRVQRYDPVA